MDICETIQTTLQDELCSMIDVEPVPFGFTRPTLRAGERFAPSATVRCSQCPESGTYAVSVRAGKSKDAEWQHRMHLHVLRRVPQITSAEGFAHPPQVSVIVC